MERFNYPSLKALRKESSEILRLLEAESYGEQAQETARIKAHNNRIEEMDAEADRMRSQYG